MHKLQSPYICGAITNQIKNNEAYNRTKIGNYFRNIRELKPDTPSGIAQGNSQLAKYVVQLEEQTGETWTGVLDT